MMKALALLAILASADPAVPVIGPHLDLDPHRQFDFWVGEWSVLNRHMNADGTWRDGDTTRARITPVCGDRAILEEWAGTFGQSFMNGFSLRAYDPEAEQWQLLLSWTTTGNDGFGRLFGSFRHGRGEFFSTTRGPRRTRYSFSDGLPNTVRWDSSTTNDAGVNWKTDWIMEFSRTRAAADVTQDELFDTAWTSGEVSPHPEARALDGMLGTWTGTQQRGGATHEARLRAKLLNKDCLVVDVLGVREQDSDGWDERLCVRGYVAGSERWESWRLSERDTVLRQFTATPAAGTAAFTFDDEASRATIQETITMRDGVLEIVESARMPGSDDPVVLSSTTLRRAE